MSGRQLLSLCLCLLGFNALVAQQNLKNALAFDGVNDYISCDPKPQYNLTRPTIECWVKPGLLVGNACIVSNRTAALTRYSIHMSLTALGLFNGVNYRSIPFICVPGRWYHLAFVCGATSTLVYVNGELQGTIAQTVNNVSTDLPLYIGIPYPAFLTERFLGAIDEVRIWNKEISQDVIRQNMYTSISANADLVALYHFNEGTPEGTNTSVTTVADASATANVGLLNNFSLTAGLSNFVLSAGLTLAAPPVIASFTPSSGPVTTTTITVTGSGFSANAANNIVYFGPVKAQVTASTATSLTLTVPAGATFQPFCVTNLETGLVGFSRTPFATTYVGGALALNTRFDINDVVAPTCITYGDMDGDGKPDLIVTDQTANQVQIYRNISVSGTLNASSFATRATFLSGTFTAGVVVGDLDGDGKLDLATAPGADGLVGIYLNTSSVGTIAMNSRITVGLGLSGNGRKIEIADLDLDGKAEILVLAGNGVSVLRNFSVLGLLSFSVGTGFPLPINFTDMKIVDMDGDGLKDILLVNQTTSRLYIGRNISLLGLVQLAAFQEVVISDVPYRLDAGDLDGDGKPDLAIGCGNNLLNLYKNTSVAGSISLGAAVAVSTGAVTEAVTIGDLDNDNKPDIVLSGGTSAQIKFYKNQGSTGVIDGATLAAPVNFAVAGNANLTQIADVDLDGKPDITVMSPATISVFFNNTSNINLPVEITAFTGAAGSKNIELKWTTAYESNSDRFEVERSINGSVYTKIKTLSAAGFSSTKTDYRTVDENPANGTNIYRLHQIDRDGRSAYSRSISVNWNNSSRVAVTMSPQPMRDHLNITIRGAETGSRLSIFDINGRGVKSIDINGASTLRLDRNGFSSGTYIFRLISSKGNLLEQGKIVVE